jgi:hypothetical protein
MCWSPTADLVAGSTITALGIATIAGVRRPRDLPLAALPIVLGVHQLVESIVWRSADGMIGTGVGNAATLLWAVIAYPLLPAFVPLAVLIAAERGARTRLVPFVAIGLMTCAALANALASGPVTADPVGHTMRYGVHVTHGTLAVLGYLVATIGGLLASDQMEIRTLGIVAGAGALACYALWQAAFVSTWCALAAVTSVIVLHWVRGVRARHGAVARAGSR